MKTLWPKPEDLEDVSDHQRGAYANATRSPLGILTGGPGTGKTWSTSAILKAITKEHGAENVGVCAPTGKAAIRMTQAMSERSLSIEATTGHRLLGVSRNGHDGKGWGFIHDAGNPLPYRFLAVDESFMLGTNLASKILAACAPGTHVLFTGDEGQLLPVGHGAPVRDMVRAGLPHGQLTKVERNAGDIVRACQAMRAGRIFYPSKSINVAAGNNWLHIETRNSQQSLDRLRELLGRPADTHDTTWDMQAITARREKGDLSKDHVNKVLRAVLNPRHEGGEIAGNPFRVGDKVICTENFMLPVVEQDGGDWNESDHSDFVANGEIGRVELIDKKEILVSFDCPRRTVAVRGELLSIFDWAYGITCHKAQGSQWPVVIALVDDSRGAGMLCSREWWYTAISRMQTLCVTIGKFSVIRQHCAVERSSMRKTFLAEQVLGLAA